ncbi:hypothetical protein V2J09_024327, partial [Rumex salicifolius]
YLESRIFVCDRDIALRSASLYSFDCRCRRLCRFDTASLTWRSSLATTFSGSSSNREISSPESVKKATIITRFKSARKADDDDEVTAVSSSTTSFVSSAFSSLSLPPQGFGEKHPAEGISNKKTESRVYIYTSNQQDQLGDFRRQYLQVVTMLAIDDVINIYTEEAMPTNDMPELERRDPELPLKEEVCGVFDSSTIYESMQGDWRVSRLENFEVKMPLIRPESPLHATDSKDFNRDVVEELTVKRYKKPVSDKKDKGPIISEAAKSRNGQWSHLYQLAGGHHKPNSIYGDSLTRARDQLMMNARDNSGRSVDKHVRKRDEDCCEMTDINKIVSGGTMAVASNPALRALSSFSSLFKNRNVKGKEVVGGCPMNMSVHDLGPNECRDNNTHPTDALLEQGARIKELLRDHPNDFRFDLNQGISLREWLKPGRSSMNKVERLSLLREIVGLVDNAHSQGVVLLNMSPLFFNLLPSNKVQYIGSSSKVAQDIPNTCNMSKKRRIEDGKDPFSMSGTKQQKVEKDNSQYQQIGVTSRCESEFETDVEEDCSLACASRLVVENTFQTPRRSPHSLEAYFLSEEKWYTCPEQLAQKTSTTTSSNIYFLGLLAFELLCSIDSLDALSVAMLNVNLRIFPPSFLSENPKEAAFIMWLLHPQPSLRPTTREILQSDFIDMSESEKLSSSSELSSIRDNDDMEKELLVDFLISLKERKEEKASKLMEGITFLEADIKEAEKRHLSRTSSGFCPDSSCKKESRLVGDLSQLEKAYFSMRAQTTVSEETLRSDRGLLRHPERVSRLQTQSECVTSVNQKSNDRLDTFFQGLCKFTRYNRFEVCGSVRNGELLNSTSAICSLSFDRDEDYIAAAGVSRKIKIFDLATLLCDSAEHNYPAIEMVNNSKLSCISWNSYIRNYLASTDYDGAVKIWDASLGKMFSQYKEHQKRAWSVDFSQMDPTKFATGSDDWAVKIWSANDKKSICTLWNPANICSLQFSPSSSHLLAFGSADYKIYGYDLRHTRIPWCTLSGHDKTVSYVKFMDSDTLVSASTDNTLKLWNLSKTNPTGLSSEACSSTFTGHTNEKNFVGLSVRDGYITCGSETNEVFAYHKFLPTPITSHKFGSVDPISGHETREDNYGQFVSSVCWRRKSNMVVAANSSGSIKILRLVIDLGFSNLLILTQQNFSVFLLGGACKPSNLEPMISQGVNLVLLWLSCCKVIKR